MISRLPVCWRAESMAVSLASLPLEVKKLFSRWPGVICAIFSASATAVSVRVKCGGVLEFVDLRLHRAGDARVGVAYADGDDAAEEVEVALPFHVPDVLHVAALEGQRVGEVVGDGGVDELLLLAVDFASVHGVGRPSR